MSSWPSKQLDVTNELRLDPLNVRLDRSSQNAPQGDIIRDLFLNEGAMELAKGIATIGWLTHERPVVLKENGAWVVVEGNRRTAALKALHNPRLVPASFTVLTKLAADIPNLKTLQNISVLVAPDRGAANELIGSLHTTSPRKPWSPLRQADFFYAQLESGSSSVRELKQQYPTSDVPKFVRMAEMHKLLQTVDYADPELAKYVRRRNFPISTFDRLYANDDFLKLAKLAVDTDTGHVTTRGDKAGFSKLATKVVDDIKSKRVNTRVLNTPESETYKKYMADLEKLEVKASGPARPVIKLDTLIAPKNPHKTQLHLDTAGLHPLDEYPSTVRILNELSGIRYRDFPNATFDLIRTFLEKSLKAYAHSVGEKIPPKNAGQFVYLDDALLWLQGRVSLAGEKSLIQPINKLRSKKSFNNFQLSKEFLDAANHNHEIFVTHEEVKDLWDSILNIMRFYLKN